MISAMYPWGIVFNNNNTFTVTNSESNRVRYGVKYGIVKKLLPGDFTVNQAFYAKSNDAKKKYYLLMISNPLPADVPLFSHIESNDAYIVAIHYNELVTCSNETLDCNTKLVFENIWSFLPKDVPLPEVMTKKSVKQAKK